MRCASESIDHLDRCRREFSNRKRRETGIAERRGLRIFADVDTERPRGLERADAPAQLIGLPQRDERRAGLPECGEVEPIIAPESELRADRRARNRQQYVAQLSIIHHQVPPCARAAFGDGPSCAASPTNANDA
jgi:hypothetical protein